jgi:hypothetical protein
MTMPDDTWVVEINSYSDHPDYFGPFPTLDAARNWANERAIEDAILICVEIPENFDKRMNDDE